MISYDILIIVINAELEEKQLPVKSLLVELPYSVMGIRLHLKKLIKDKWLALEKNESDRRFKNVKPTDKLRSKFFLFTKHIEEYINTDFSKKN
jgi:DNA-binding MarR family transcriptional regulator